MKIAYLVNRYPAVSHSFIRREVLAIEASGIDVARYSLRAAAADLPDPQDRREAERTQVVLGHGIAALAAAVLAMLVSRPRGVLGAFALALRQATREPLHGWRHLAYWIEACWLARNLGEATHLHAHFGTNPAAVARLLRRINGTPYSFTVHGPDEFDAPGSLDLKGKIADAKLVVAISSYGRSQLMRWSAPAHWDKIVVVRCGVDRLFTADCAETIVTEPALCCVARLSAQKGLPLLIQAAARLAGEGVAFRLVLVGDGELRHDLERMIAAHRLEDRISITGFVGAVAVSEILTSSRAMVLPSFAEGLPVVIMEALALRTPVIATAIAGTPELVDAQCGWLIPAGSIEALAEAMRDALSASPERLRAMGEVGRRRVLERHDSERNGAELAGLIGRPS